MGCLERRNFQFLYDYVPINKLDFIILKKKEQDKSTVI